MKFITNNPYIRMLKMSWRYAGDRRWVFVVTYVFFTLSNLVFLTEPYVIGKLFNTIQAGGDDVLRRVVFWLLLYAAITPAFWLFHGFARVWERKTAFFIERNFRQNLFQTVTEMPLRWHTDHHSGQTHDKIEKSARALRHFSQEGFRYLDTIVKATVSLAAIAWFLPRYGILAVVTSLITLAIMWRFDLFLAKNRKQINVREHDVAKTFFDYVSNIKTIITLRLERLVNREYVSSIMKVFSFLRINIYVNEWKWFSLGMMIMLLTFLLMLVYIWQGVRSAEVFLLGSLVAFYGYVSRFTESFFDFAWQWEDVVWYATDSEAVDSILTAHRQIETKRRYRRNIVGWQKIDIDHLWFRYENDGQEDKKSHLDDVSIQLKRGEKVALVGESGSGKSTLLALLRGLDLPQKAEIAIDGKPARDVGILSKITTLIPQDPEIFDNTIEYNITAGIRHRPDEVDQACRLARFDVVLRRLPKGLSTDIKERGVNLSGGEKQWLALARGIFAAQDSSLILLDESTSSVDAVNEMEIYHNLFQRFKKECVVAAIHRLHLLPLFDTIYVLEQGKVVEQGTFEELVAKSGGALALMWEKYSEHLNMA